MSQTGNLEVNRGHRERIATLLGHVSRQPARSHVHEHIRAPQSPSFQIFSFFFTSSSFFSASGTPPSSTCVIYPPYVCTSISCRASRPSTIQPLDLCRPSLRPFTLPSRWPDSLCHDSGSSRLARDEPQSCQGGDGCRYGGEGGRGLGCLLSRSLSLTLPSRWPDSFCHGGGSSRLARNEPLSCQDGDGCRYGGVGDEDLDG